MPPSSDSGCGEVFLDARGNDRAMRLTWHHDRDLVVLSPWRDDACVGTFRLASTDVGAFVDALVEGLHDLPSTASFAAFPPVVGEVPRTDTRGLHAAAG